MMARHARAGRAQWIGLRPERRSEMQAVQAADFTEDGLIGDHGRAGKRALTLIQAEHLPVIAALLGHQDIHPNDLRRNIVVSGINVLALRHRTVRIGTGVIKIEGPCPPCSRMEEAFGPGGYSAVRGHGGVYASVVQPGAVRVGDEIAPVE